MFVSIIFEVSFVVNLFFYWRIVLIYGKIIFIFILNFNIVVFILIIEGVFFLDSYLYGNSGVYVVFVEW